MTKATERRLPFHTLDAENRKLRAEYQVASERVDLEAELEQSRSDVAELTSRVLEYEKQREAEGQELKQATCELDRTRGELRTANEDLAGERETTAALTTRVSDLETELEGLRGECRRVEADSVELQAPAVQEREAISKDAELKLYRTLEAERAKWEAR